MGKEELKGELERLQKDMMVLEVRRRELNAREEEMSQAVAKAYDEKTPETSVDEGAKKRVGALIAHLEAEANEQECADQMKRLWREFDAAKRAYVNLISRERKGMIPPVGSAMVNAPEPTPTPNPQWEYRVMSISSMDTRGAGGLDEKLNQYGRLGWEVFEVESDHFFFKRMKSGSAP